MAALCRGLSASSDELQTREVRCRPPGTRGQPRWRSGPATRGDGPRCMIRLEAWSSPTGRGVPGHCALHLPSCSGSPHEGRCRPAGHLDAHVPQLQSMRPVARTQAAAQWTWTFGRICAQDPARGTAVSSAILRTILDQKAELSLGGISELRGAGEPSPGLPHTPSLVTRYGAPRAPQ